MSDYINKSALIKAIDEQVKGWGKQGIVPSLFSAIAIVQNQPTIDEKEIIRKYGEQIIKKLEFESEWSEPTFDEDGYCNDDSWEMVWLDKAIEIIKEECGINE